MTDFRTVIRGLSRRPGYTLAAAATLAVGIGANTSVFTVVNGVLLQPLPFPDPDRLVTLWAVTPPPQRISSFPVSYPDFLDWREQLTSVERLAFTYAASTTVQTAEGPESAVAAAVTEGFLDVLGVRPARGTALLPGARRAVVVKHRLWETHFGADPDIVGRTISLDDGPYTVVGVLDESATYPLWADLFVPLTPELVDRRGLNERGFRIDTRVIARMRSRGDLAAVREELGAVAGRLAEAYPGSNLDWDATALPMVDARVEQLRGPLYAILGAVGFVLLIACTNVANLNLAAVLDRRRDIAVRGALGEPTGWFIRRSLLESTLLSLAGGAAGLLMASWAVDVFALRASRLIPYADGLEVNVRVFLFTAVAIFVSAVLASVAPNIFTLRHRRADALRLSSGITGFAGGQKVQGALAAVQIGMTLTLLIGAGLLLRSFVSLQRMDLGFEPDRLLGVRIDPPAPRYADPLARAKLFAALERETSGPEGLEGAALITHMPLVGGIVATPVRTGNMEQPVTARFNQASAEFFAVAGIPVVRGRAFLDAETRGASQAVIISDNLADALFSEEDPLGATVRYDVINGMSPRFGQTVEGVVVGVVGNVRYQVDAAQAAATIYAPAPADPWPSTYVLARARAGAGDPVEALRAAIQRVDPDLSARGIDTIDNAIGRSLESRRMGLVLTGVFAGFAMALAAVGLFGVLSYLVRQRAGEIGLRVALGARASDIARWVLTRAGTMFAGGVVLGLAGAAATTGLIRRMLFGVGPMSPGTIAAVTIVLAVVMAAAAGLPAWRAARIDPMCSLRTD